MSKLTFEQKKAALQAQIDKIEAQEQAQLTTKNALIGQVVSEEMENNPSFQKIVNALIEKSLKKNSDRLIFGLKKLTTSRGRPKATTETKEEDKSRFYG